METSIAGRAGREPVRYRIVIRGELRDSAAEVLEHLTVRSEEGLSVITGDIVDQSQLHRIVDWLGEMGVEIVSIAPADDPNA